LSEPKISSSSKIESLPGRLIRLTTPAPKFFHWRPGQSAYITLPKISGTPLEGHPFTISTIETKSSQRSELKFLIQDRRGKGFTRRLYDSDGTSTIGNVLVDGPYSTPPRLVGYDAVLLIAGGSGVTFTLPLLLDLVE
jgi:predicted ferric reductase